MDALDRRDIDALLDLSTPQPTLSSALPEAGADFRGREGLERYFSMLGESWDEFHTVVDEYRDLGDRVLMLGRFTGRGKGSGVMADAPSGAVFDFRDGKVSRVRLYLDHGEALRAVGLTE
jgi:ketosteroid isomerase-like protein